jgi:hypothetical protein
LNQFAFNLNWAVNVGSADVGDYNLVSEFEQMGPAIKLPVWLVCHQELRTNLWVRRVFDFIARE